MGSILIVHVASVIQLKCKHYKAHWLSDVPACRRVLEDY